MNEAEKYAKECLEVLKTSEINPFDELNSLAIANGINCVRGAYTAWGVLELMIMYDWYKRQMKEIEERMNKW